ncbi:MAG: PhoU domain-containing protein, partial [Smithella sp.]
MEVTDEADSLCATNRTYSDIARKVIEEDNDIDRLDTDIEERCIKILALRQPAAIDLRFITTAIKITGH